MYKKIKPFYMVVESPLHAGSGTELGIVDQPIQREKHTNFPKIEASGLKGCIRQAFEKTKGELTINSRKITDRKATASLAFGPENGGDHAGALGFTDARLILFPVKSMKGVFAWITCPQVLNRFANDLALAGTIVPERPKENTISSASNLIIKGSKIVLEEFTYDVKEDSNCSKFVEWLSENIMPTGAEYSYWREKIKKDVVILPNDDFRDFVNLSAEVITRIRIDPETGTVQPGALFTEEYLPSDSILYSLALATPVFKKEDEDKGVFEKSNDKQEEDLVMEYFTKGLPKVLQIGANATLGKGIVRTRI